MSFHEFDITLVYIEGDTRQNLWQRNEFMKALHGVL